MDTTLLYSYILPGRATDPRVGMTQAMEAERLGLGGVFASERHDTKEAAVIVGALSQVTSRLQLVTGLTYFSTRHPLETAGVGSTMQWLSGNRYVMGFGRSVAEVFKLWGVPRYNIADMTDYVKILRGLWAGEKVSYQGRLGNFPAMQLVQPPTVPPPLMLGAVGPKTLAFGGQYFDAVVLHPFLTVEGTARSVEIIRKAASEAGRDPSAITVYSCVVTAPDGALFEAERMSAVDARAVSYFTHRQLGLPLLQANGWDEGPMNRLIELGLGMLEISQGDNTAIRARLSEAVGMLPKDWLTTGAALGSPAQCARRLKEYHDAGADKILIHGITPDRQESLVKAFASL